MSGGGLTERGGTIETLSFVDDCLVCYIKDLSTKLVYRKAAARVYSYAAGMGPNAENSPTLPGQRMDTWLYITGGRGGGAG